MVVEKIIKFWKKYWIPILVFIVTLVVVLDTAGFPVEAILLAVTAVVVYWYSYETSLMRREVSKQNYLQTRPVVTISKSRDQPNRLSIWNKGRGPGLNIRITDLHYKHEKREKWNRPSFKQYPLNFLAPGENDLAKLFLRDSPGDPSHMPASCQELFNTLINEKTISIITTDYEDMEGGVFQTITCFKYGKPDKIIFNRKSK